MKKIYLRPYDSKKFSVVDDSDFMSLQNFEWSLDDSHFGFEYAYRYERRESKIRRYRRIRMHRSILGVNDSKDHIDHINHNGLDNRRKNLRVCTPVQNQYNKKKKQGCRSAYKGVTWHSGQQRWRARISVNKKRIHLGFFDTEVDAAIAYNHAARTHFQEFALLNKVAP